MPPKGWPSVVPELSLEEPGEMTELIAKSPRIHRCGLCGALVHPADPAVGAAWCGRCHRAVPVDVDGGE